MRYLAVVAALATTLAASPAFASLWRLASRGGTSPERSLFYVDIDSIRRDGNDITLVTASLFEATTSARDFDKSIITRKANCATMTSQITRSDFYRNGRLLESSSKPGNLITHQANSVMYGTLLAACGKRAYLGSPVTTPLPYWPASSVAPPPPPPPPPPAPPAPPSPPSPPSRGNNQH